MDAVAFPTSAPTPRLHIRLLDGLRISFDDRLITNVHDWIVPERERLRAAFLRAAKWLAELLEVEPVPQYIPRRLPRRFPARTARA